MVSQYLSLTGSHERTKPTTGPPPGMTKKSVVNMSEWPAARTSLEWRHRMAAQIPKKELLMKYILLDYVQESGWPKLTKAEQENWLGAYKAYLESMKKAGVLIGSTGLQRTSSATTVRVASGKTQVLDGPYADSKEQLGGFRIIQVADLDAAISWAARCPTALHGVVEVRPIMDMSIDDLLQEVRGRENKGEVTCGN
jgi:hypothetical protein